MIMLACRGGRAMCQNGPLSTLCRSPLRGIGMHKHAPRILAAWPLWSLHLNYYQELTRMFPSTHARVHEAHDCIAHSFWPCITRWHKNLAASGAHLHVLPGKLARSIELKMVAIDRSRVPTRLRHHCQLLPPLDRTSLFHYFFLRIIISSIIVLCRRSNSPASIPQIKTSNYYLLHLHVPQAREFPLHTLTSRSFKMPPNSESPVPRALTPFEQALTRLRNEYRSKRDGFTKVRGPQARKVTKEFWTHHEPREPRLDIDTDRRPVSLLGAQVQGVG
ncbi:hypothetical protein B0T22DRAFT_298804 [Podospora appendiculata]|uniref:Uncharacterized protein n=1 Tax=Podospora appendiculata TaxID=314037 RepID=A0AAE1C7J4_9PEZI|nr:hypothetical protein B0T22DRAFT_298804 [Podospora appendiculata]